MSRENVQVVHGIWEAWYRGDLPGVLEHYSPTIVWDMTHYRDWPDARYEGHDGVRRFLSEWLDLWDEYQAGADEILATPDGRVLVLGWQRGKGRGSGLEMEFSWG